MVSPPEVLQDTASTKYWHALKDGRCQACETPLAGRFEARPGTWGPRRKPVMLRKPVNLKPSA